MRNMLVTGGAGFIGSNFILEALKDQGKYNIINLDILSYAGNLENLTSVEEHPDYHFEKGDVCDKETITALLQKYNIEKVVHFAAESHVDRSIETPEIFLKTNVLGTFTLLECARQYWSQLPEGYQNKTFLHVSTDEVYGSLGEIGLFTEETSYKPNSPYSASKAASDHLARSYVHTYGFPVLVTNCSNNYGPFQFPEKLIPLLINNILNNKPLPVYGEGKNIRDWLYVRDHCRAILCVLENGNIGEQYNIGGHNEWTNIDIVRLICKYMDEQLKLPESKSSSNLITYVKDRPGHDLRYAIDATKIKRELGWVPSETFETGIQKTINWYLENKEWLSHTTNGSYQNYYKEMYGNR
ncbi:MAG: dTDP-glucose 4,6-dehydratase [Fibrobacteria bacterium]|nr:dTDP-glucose 4,6-dehydratase [Fibrobacteria bacterium]